MQILSDRNAGELRSSIGRVTVLLEQNFADLVTHSRSTADFFSKDVFTFACYTARTTLILSPQIEAWVSTQIKTGAFEDQSAFLSPDLKRRAALRELVEQGQQLGMND